MVGACAALVRVLYGEVRHGKFPHWLQRRDARTAVAETALDDFMRDLCTDFSSGEMQAIWLHVQTHAGGLEPL